jgi:exosortase family protein XrtF
VIRYISKAWNQIPKAVRYFFLRALIAFVIWKFIYLVFLLPPRVLDGPLTYSVGELTTKTLNIFTRSHDFTVVSAVDTIEIEGSMQLVHQMHIYVKKNMTLSIADVCNALELLVLYAGFIICFPSPPARKIQFILAGFILIYLINILRCAALVLIFVHYNEYLDISHHFFFTFIVYAFIFLLWYFYTKNLRLNAGLTK